MPKKRLVKGKWLVVFETTTNTRIYGQHQLGMCWCVVTGCVIVGKIFIVKLYSHKIFS